MKRCSIFLENFGHLEFKDIQSIVIAYHPLIKEMGETSGEPPLSLEEKQTLGTAFVI